MSVGFTRRSAAVARRKLQKNFRLNPEATAMLAELSELLGLTETDVVEQSIRAAYRRETGRKRPAGYRDSGESEEKIA